MWYFAWILGVLLACSFGIINVLWLEAQESLDQHTSVLDPLTKLPNRVEFLQQLEQKITQLRNAPGRLSILMISMQHFGNTLEQMKETDLDAMVINFSETIRHSTRAQVDIVCRYDAKTFVVILPGAHIAIAEATAKHICQACSAQFLSQKMDSVVSIGVTEYQELNTPKQEAINALLLLTDQRLKKSQQLANNTFVSS